MSLWDKYLAPGDLRQQAKIQHEQNEALKIQAELNLAKQAASQSEKPRLDAATRERRQNGLLFGGVAFAVLSLFITRRSLAKKNLAMANLPPDAPIKVDGPLEAVQALGIATLNVFAFAMAGVGGVMKYFDVADVEDLREGYRRSLGYDVHSGESAADKEIEGWIAEVLARKDGMGNLREGVAEKILELELERKKLEELEGKRR